MKLALMLLLSLLLTGCASVMSTNISQVSIQSDPPGAEFIISNKKGTDVSRGITPQTVYLRADAGYMRGEDYSIKFQKPGYADELSTHSSQLNGWYFGNLLFGGAIGMLVIDPLTGSMWKLPQKANVLLHTYRMHDLINKGKRKNAD
jgi:hypothetical protein